MNINGIHTPFTIARGALVPRVVDYKEENSDRGDWPALIQAYVDRGEIREEMFTPGVRDGMVEYLTENGVLMEDSSLLTNQGYDEYFALAYDYARRRANSPDDPLSNAYGSAASRGTDWNYQVRTFSDFESQGVISENILAAGAIDYIYELGERMSVFQLCDTLMLRWAAGEIDVIDNTADKLYRYWKRRENRSTASERGMLYKRVLNKGGAKVLNRMVVNEPHPANWRNLFEKVAEHISKREKVDSDPGGLSPVSRNPIYQAVREIQYNLTEYATGMAHKQAQEIYFQLTEALDLLADEQIIAHFGGTRRKTMWTVIEQLAKNELKRSIPIGPTLRVALDGNKVFQFIADFDEGNVADEDFQAFLETAESYILNSAVMGDEPEMDADEEDDDFEDIEEIDDDFEDDDF